MTALVGPYLIVCTLLALGGIAKLVTPAPARRAIRAIGVDVPMIAVRALGAAELALAVAAAYSGGTILPILVGVAYLAFAAFVIMMLRTADATSCGCFGNSSAPPSTLHVIVNVLAAVVAFGSAGLDQLPTTLDDQAGAGIPLLLLVAVGAYALYLVLTLLPTVLSPARPGARPFALLDHRDAGT